MGFWHKVFGIYDATPQNPSGPAAFTTGDINSEWFRQLVASVSGSPKDAIRNSAVSRSLNLISGAIGMLPLQLHSSDNSGQATAKIQNHQVVKLLAERPNHWQTPFIFKRHMQYQALFHGNAYAIPIRAGSRIREILPIPHDRVRVEQKDDWSVVYILKSKDGKEQQRSPSDIFHLMGPSDDGLKGMSLNDVARDVLSLSRSSDMSLKSMMERGVRPGGLLSTDQKLSEQAIAQLRKDFEEKFAGVDNEGKWIIGEQGLKATPFSYNSRDAQGVEFRAQQIEEVARFFGVPRPLLMMDDTSWGSGIEQLGLFFVQYALAPWFVAWEQAIMRTLFSDSDRRNYFVKFNERALLRGSMKDQAEFFSKLTGSGGSPQIIEQNEARDLLDMSPHPDGYGLNNGISSGVGNDESTNE